MSTTTLSPEQLDRRAVRLHDTEVWQQIITGWDLPTPEPARSDGPESPDPVSGQGLAPAPCPDQNRADWRSLLSMPVDRLIADTVRTLPPLPPRERPLPGRLGAALPDRFHIWRRVGQPDLRPSTQLAYARQILTEWGWQNTPYRLRDARGARCICGALLTAHRLGYGSLETVDRAGAWLIAELRAQGWPGLIGPWNRHPGRTAEEAVALIDAAIRRSALAGH
ncbi:DUF6197 family protein [Streptomyces sp. DT171]|uniref:DUF6197 family protein n=1 Tax=Streptomyces sp. DT171 TaxID=3416524 RepID=UPI003CF1DF81